MFRHLTVESCATLNDLTVERTRACTQAGFPLCLWSALYLIFGDVGKGALKEMAERDFAEPISPADTPREIWGIYEELH